MSDLKFDCPHCQQSLEAPEELFGQKINCPTCNESITIQAPTPETQNTSRTSIVPPADPECRISNSQNEAASPTLSRQPASTEMGQSINFSFLDDRKQEDNDTILETTRRLMVQKAVAANLIKDENLLMIPEVVPLLIKLAGDVRDDLYRHHIRINEKDLQIPIVMNCFNYCFSKGIELLRLWNQRLNNTIELSHRPDDAIEERFDMQSHNHLSMLGLFGKNGAGRIFCAFGEEILVKPEYNDGGRRMADYLACGMYWSATIGFNFGKYIDILSESNKGEITEKYKMSELSEENTSPFLTSN